MKDFTCKQMEERLMVGLLTALFHLGKTNAFFVTLTTGETVDLAPNQILVMHRKTESFFKITVESITNHAKGVK